MGLLEKMSTWAPGKVKSWPERRAENKVRHQEELCKGVERAEVGLEGRVALWEVTHEKDKPRCQI